jgi:tetratricopeptide (TPR) repeat protein
LGQGQFAPATETYQKLSKMGPLGGSFAASGLADIAAIEGRYSDAVRMLDEGAARDLAAKNPDRAAVKMARIASLELLRGRKPAAMEAAQKALANSKSANVRFLVARSFVEAGEIKSARPLVDGLAKELQAEPQAYAKIVEGGIASKSGDARQAIKLLNEANGILDTWIGRFDLGRAYLEHFPRPTRIRSRSNAGEALSRSWMRSRFTVTSRRCITRAVRYLRTSLTNHTKSNSVPRAVERRSTGRRASPRRRITRGRHCGTIDRTIESYVVREHVVLIVMINPPAMIGWLQVGRPLCWGG